MENSYFHCRISNNLYLDKTLHFKKLWRSGKLDDDDKKIIWKWIDSFVYLSDKYIKIKTDKV